MCSLFQYNYYGNQVVRACIEEGASHLDISGEPLVSLLFKPSLNLGFTKKLRKSQSRIPIKRIGC